jgi:hypothetical protein
MDLVHKSSASCFGNAAQFYITNRIFGLDFWATFDSYYKAPEQETEFFRQVPLFYDEGVPEQCESASDFLCSPWVQMQLPWQPVIFHQWLVASLAVLLKYEVDVINLFSMRIPDHLLPYVQRFLSLRDKAMGLIRGGFSLLRLQMMSEQTVDLDVVRCILDYVVLPLVPILDFIVQVNDRDILGDLKKMAINEAGEFTQSIALYVLHNETDTFYNRSVRSLSFDDIFGCNEERLEEVVKKLDEDYFTKYICSVHPRNEEYVEEIGGYWEESEEGFWIFLKEHGSKYFDLPDDLENSKEQLLQDNSGFFLFDMYVGIKRFPSTFGYCKEEQSFGFTCTIYNLILAKFRASLDTAVFSYLKHLMWKQNKEILYTPQFFGAAGESSKAEIEKMLDDVETCEVTRDDLKKLLKAGISSPQPNDTILRSYEVNL